MEKFSVIEFFKEYPTEESAVKFFEDLRWDNGVACPYCESKNIASCKVPMPYRCRDCRKHFSIRVGTILNESKLPLQKWLLAIYILTNSKKGTSSIQLAEMIGTTQKTAWFLAHRIRETWFSNENQFEGAVEVDETFIGGKEKNKHVKDKANKGRGAVGKSTVVGVLSRDKSQVKAVVVNDTTEQTLTGIIRKNVKPGSCVYTDEFRAYTRLDEFNHEKVKHSMGEYVKFQAHTNGIESFWAILKRGFYGVYHSWSKKHLHRYVNEFSNRFNLRTLSATNKVRLSVYIGLDKKLSYKELTK